MIKKFKIFENYKIFERLAKRFDNYYVENYFKEYYSMDIIELIGLYPNIIWNNIDDERFVQDFIDNEINNLSFKDFGDWDYREYITDNLTNKKRKRILKIYKKKNETQDVEFDIDMIKDFTDQELRNVIKVDTDEYDFVKYIINNRYNDNTSAKDIIDELYGSHFNGKELYNIVRNYIDDDEIIENYIEEEDFDFKLDFLQGDISSNEKLQDELLKIDKSNVIDLANLFIKEPNKSNISDNYYFQKLYIEEYLEMYKDEKDILTAKAIKFLNSNFDLHPDIEKEFEDYMWLTDADKYNL